MHMAYSFMDFAFWQMTETMLLFRNKFTTNKSQPVVKLCLILPQIQLSTSITSTCYKGTYTNKINQMYTKRPQILSAISTSSWRPGNASSEHLRVITGKTMVLGSQVKACFSFMFVGSADRYLIRKAFAHSYWFSSSVSSLRFGVNIIF